MIRVAVIGESPYDTKPLCEVWNNNYRSKARFSSLLPTIQGSALYSPKILEAIKAELRRPNSNYNFFVLVRDLDAPRSDNAQLQKIENWKKKILSVLPNSVLLLNVQELESIILADVDAFNKIYGTTIKSITNPELMNSPKDYLISQTKKSGKNKVFAVIDNKTLIPKLDFNKVQAKCQFYREFIEELEPKLGIRPKKK